MFECYYEPLDYFLDSFSVMFGSVPKFLIKVTWFEPFQTRLKFANRFMVC